MKAKMRKSYSHFFLDPISILHIFLSMSFVCPEWVDANSLRTGTPPADATTLSSTSEEADNGEHLLQPVTPTEMSNCIPSTPENVTLERLLQQMMIDAIKQEIQITLDLREVPSATKQNVSVQERRRIIRLYRKSLAEIPAMRQSTIHYEEEKFRANQFHSFTENGDRPPGLGNRPWMALDRKRLYFSIDIHEPQDPNHETIVKMAKMKLYKMDVRPRNLIHSETVDNSVRIEVFQLAPGSSGGGSGADPPFLRRSVDSRLVSLDKASWEEFNVSSAVQDWIRSPDSNYGLEVTCDSRYRLNDLLDFVTWTQAVRDNAYLSVRLPTLNVLTQDRRIIARQVRSTTSRTGQNGDCVPGSGEHRCCRYPLTMSFRNTEWESSVIQPREHQVYYCAGTCPRGYRVAHRFSNMKSLLSEVNPDLTLPVRCAPTKLLPFPIVHFNSDGSQVTVSVIDNLLPEECMCA